jgi:phosphate transport system protein
MSDVTKGHIVHRFDEELGGVRGLVLEMGEYVREQIRASVTALATGDLALARQVIDRERRIDYFELDTDDAIFNLIAKRQPAAIDLRLVLALSKVVGFLERTGDKAGQIAWCVVRMIEREGQHPSSKILHHVRRLEEVASRMLERSLDALAEADIDLAVDVFAEGALVEDEFDAAMRHLVTFVLEDPALLGQVLDMVFALRALERVGDNAGSIAEQVVFVAKGKDVRYQNREILIDTLRHRKQR